jgi:hypothetical protein
MLLEYYYNVGYLVDVVLLLLAEAQDVEGLVRKEHVLLIIDGFDTHL